MNFGRLLVKFWPSPSILKVHMTALSITHQQSGDRGHEPPSQNRAPSSALWSSRGQCQELKHKIRVQIFESCSKYRTESHQYESTGYNQCQSQS